MTVGTHAWQVSANVTVAGDDAARKSHAAIIATNGASRSAASTASTVDLDAVESMRSLATTGASEATINRPIRGGGEGREPGVKAFPFVVVPAEDVEILPGHAPDALRCGGELLGRLPRALHLERGRHVLLELRVHRRERRGTLRRGALRPRRVAHGAGRVRVQGAERVVDVPGALVEPCVRRRHQAARYPRHDEKHDHRGFHPQRHGPPRKRPPTAQAPPVKLCPSHDGDRGQREPRRGVRERDVRHAPAVGAGVKAVEGEVMDPIHVGVPHGLRRADLPSVTMSRASLCNPQARPVTSDEFRQMT